MKYPKIYLYSIAGLHFQFILNKTKNITGEYLVRYTLENYLKPFAIDTIDKPILLTTFELSDFPPKETGFFPLSKNLITFPIVKQKTNRFLISYHISLNQLILFLSYYINILLQKNNNGLIIHSSSAAINQKEAVLFTAKTGGGKSTILQLLDKKYVPLADDMSIIRYEKGEFYIYQGPFLEFPKVKISKTNKKYLLKKIYILKKSRGFKVKICSQTEIELFKKEIITKNISLINKLIKKYQKGGKIQTLFFNKKDSICFKE